MLNRSAYALLGLLLSCTTDREPQPTSPPPAPVTGQPSARRERLSLSLSLIGAPFYETSTITAVASDPRGTWLYRWYVDDALVPGVTGDTLTGLYFARGDRVRAVGVRAEPAPATVTSPAVQVLNAPPRVTLAAVAPGTHYPWDDFTIDVIESDDADGDPLTYAATWYVNGLPAGVTTATLRLRTLAPGDLVWADVYADDGLDRGPAYAVPAVMVAAYEKPPRIDRFTAAPTASAYAAPVLLAWQTEAEACAIDPAVGSLDAEERFGGSRFVSPVTSTAYTLTCRSGSLVTAATAAVTVAPPPPVMLFAFTAPEIDYGAAVTLAWQVTGAAACALDGTAVGFAGAVTEWPIMPRRAELRCDQSVAYAGVYVRRPLIHEVAWMGTSADPNDEWIELRNTGRRALSLAGWTLVSDDGAPSIALTGTLPAGGFALYERTNDDSVPGVAATGIFTGSLSNTGERLVLRDALGRMVDAAGSALGWPAGDNTAHASMERTGYTTTGTEPAAWTTASAAYAVGYGTPKAENADAAHPLGGDRLDEVAVFVNDHAAAAFPAAAESAMHAALVAAIDAAAVSLDFAMYGFEDAGEISAALGRAVARGVQVRGVIDTDTQGRFAMGDGPGVFAALPTGAAVVDGDDRLMHHKFFIFDRAAVWVGSANANGTDLRTGYNCNAGVLVRSAALAAAFQREFDDLYAGRFHRAKAPRGAGFIPRLADGTRLEAAFAPVDDPVYRVLVPAIEGAVGSIDAAIFTFTHPAVADALVAAHERGVTVRVIVDATGAANAYSAHTALREAGIAVKVENWPGKLHQKSLIIDGYRVMLGSLNWTQAGNTENDESVLVIDNRAIAAALGAHFQADWSAIPEAYLLTDPRAEGADSPGSLADFLDNDEDGLTDEGAPESLVRADEAEGSINLYFNKPVWPHAGNVANGAVDLQARLITRINAATQAVDLALYEINLPQVVAALQARAATGVMVRLAVDAKDPDPRDADEWARYAEMRLYLERLRRGADGVAGTGDDVRLRADAPVFAVTDAALRTAAGLPAAADDLPWLAAPVGLRMQSGRLLADGERKPDGAAYYAAGDAMHHKFAVFDARWVWTGSWNPTVTSQYGDAAAAAAGLRAGNSDVAVELHAPAVAAVYAEEFAELWAGRFHGRKENVPRTTVSVGGRTVEILFSPRGEALTRLHELVTAAAASVDAAVFAWSDAALAAAVHARMLTQPGFRFRGVFEGVFWDAWWSAAVPLSGRTLPGSGPALLPPAPVRYDREDRKLHAKLMVLDAGTTHDPVVVVGSTNWTASGDRINDENLLVIHDGALADQARQFIEGRWIQAGGRPFGP